MSFLFRAALVIGVLSYFEMQRQGAVRKFDAIAGLSDRAATLPAAWNTLPSDARQPIAKDAASEIARQLAGTQLSQDTLGEMDRRPEWRGVAAR